MHAKDRSRLAYKITYALEHPDRIAGYARRRGRDAWLALRARDHVAYYRAVMRSDAARSRTARSAARPTSPGWRSASSSSTTWPGTGSSPRTGCWRSAAGTCAPGGCSSTTWTAENYYGVDISPDILLAAQQTVIGYGLQAKLPHLSIVRDLRLEFLPDAQFDVVHAHSVFSHSPLAVIDECLAHVGRVMVPGGFFDFTFDRTEGAEHQVLREDFYYRTQTLTNLAERHGLHARFMDDWELLPHEQSKIRVTRPT